MTFVIVVSLLLLAAFSLSYLIRSSLLISLPTAVFGITVILYAFGILDLLLIGFWIAISTIVTASLISVGHLIKNKELAKHLKSLLTPGLAIFLSLALVSFFLTRELQLFRWDEFSHWGTIVKATFLFDALGPFNPVDLEFLSYPPSISLFEYFVTKLGGTWLEANIFWAFQLIIWSLFPPFLAQLTWRRWGQIVVAAALTFLAPLAFFNSLHLSIVDPLLGLLFGYCLAITYVGSVTNWRLVLHLCLGIFMLTLSKDSGLFMAGLVVALYLIRLLASRKSEGENWSWKRFAILGVLPIFTLIAAHQSWAALVRAKVDNAPFSTPIDLEMLLGASENSAPAHWQEVQENFVFALTNFPINFGGTILIPQVQLIALFLVLIGVLEYLVSSRSGQKFNFGLIVITALGAVAYTVGLLVLYLFRFGDFEAVRLASYERYLATYWAGIVLLIVLVALWLLSGSPRESNREDSSKARVGAAKPVFILFLLVTISALMPIQQISEFFQNPSARGTEVRSSLEPALEQLSRVQIKPTDRVWIIAQHTAGREYLMLKYELMENSVNPGGWSIGTPVDETDVWTVQKDTQAWQQELSSYDFVLVYLSSASFENEFGPLFSDPSKIAANAIYEVIEENGELKLTQAPRG